MKWIWKDQIYLKSFMLILSDYEIWLSPIHNDYLTRKSMKCKRILSFWTVLVKFCIALCHHCNAIWAIINLLFVCLFHLGTVLWQSPYRGIFWRILPVSLIHECPGAQNIPKMTLHGKCYTTAPRWATKVPKVTL